MRIALYVRVSREEMESSLINQKEYIKCILYLTCVPNFH